jgi:hypothetical protein
MEKAQCPIIGKVAQLVDLLAAYVTAPVRRREPQRDGLHRASWSSRFRTAVKAANAPGRTIAIFLYTEGRRQKRYLCDT